MNSRADLDATTTNSPSRLKIESIAGETPVEITQVEGGVVSFGRETENNIVIDSLAVSRRHASLSQAGTQWVFRDFGSTNGSWVNSVQIIAGQVRLIRNGDIVKLGDFPLRVTVIDEPRPAVPPLQSLLLFFGDRFESEIFLGSARSRFVIGGPEGDMFIEGESRDQPQIIVVFSNGRLELMTGKVSRSVIVNGLASTGTTALVDRDEVVVGPYRLIVNDICSARKPAPLQSRVPLAAAVPPSPPPLPQAYEHAQLPEHLRQRPAADDGWESEAAKRQIRSGRKFVFDRALSDKTSTGTIALDAADMELRHRFESSSAQRFFSGLQQSERENAPFAKTSEMVLVIIGIVVFLAIILFLLFLAFNLWPK